MLASVVHSIFSNNLDKGWKASSPDRWIRLSWRQQLIHWRVGSPKDPDRLEEPYGVQQGQMRSHAPGTGTCVQGVDNTMIFWLGAHKEVWYQGSRPSSDRYLGT